MEPRREHAVKSSCGRDPCVSSAQVGMHRVNKSVGIFRKSTIHIIFLHTEMEYRPHPDVCVRPSETHGLGVYAAAALPADTIIERCAVLQDMYLRDRQRPCAFQRYLYFAN